MLNDAFAGYLGKLAINSNVISLFCEIIEEHVKSEFRTKSQDKKNCQAQIDKLNLRMSNARKLMLDGDIDMAEYTQVKQETQQEITALMTKLDNIMTNSEKLEILQRTGNILQNLPVRFRTGTPAVQKKIIGSIFSSKLIFENGEFRTKEPDLTFSLITDQAEKLGDWS